MKVLLDTNIIIHREASRILRRDIGSLFYWLDHLSVQKCIHPFTIDEIRRHKDPAVVGVMEVKLESYYLLKTQAPDSDKTRNIRAKYDKNPNDQIDTSLLNEVYCNRVDMFITEDRKVHRKAAELGISERVFTIDEFLEKTTAENPELAEYKVLSVKKAHFGNLDVKDPFFDSFKHDYQGFEEWFNRKADEIAYVCYAEDGAILAFLYIKQEHPAEDYSDIEPPFNRAHRLKIGTFKVISNGYKLGERFLKIVFDNALVFRVEEIYVTVFDNTEDQERLINLLTDWGFIPYGTKGEAENVLVKKFIPHANVANPQLTYPYFSGQQKKYIVPIYPEYHTELFPDSILRTESPNDFVESKPNRNAISKVYISRSYNRSLEPGDVVVFYRTKYNGPAYYTSVTTTIGVVQSVTTNIPNLEKFIRLCRKRSVFTDEELARHWNYTPNNRPFVVSFLYVHSFPTRLNLQSLQELDIIGKAPRGFEPLSDSAFTKLMENSNADNSLVVH